MSYLLAIFCAAFLALAACVCMLALRRSGSLRARLHRELRKLVVSLATTKNKKGGAARAKAVDLGEKSKFYYNKELGRYVEAGKEAEAEAEALEKTKAPPALFAKPATNRGSETTPKNAASLTGPAASRYAALPGLLVAQASPEQSPRSPLSFSPTRHSSTPRTPFVPKIPTTALAEEPGSPEKEAGEEALADQGVNATTVSQEEKESETQACQSTQECFEEATASCEMLSEGQANTGAYINSDVPQEDSTSCEDDEENAPAVPPRMSLDNQGYATNAYTPVTPELPYRSYEEGLLEAQSNICESCDNLHQQVEEVPMPDSGWIYTEEQTDPAIYNSMEVLPEGLTNVEEKDCKHDATSEVEMFEPEEQASEAHGFQSCAVGARSEEGMYSLQPAASPEPFYQDAQAINHHAAAEGYEYGCDCVWGYPTPLPMIQGDGGTNWVWGCAAAQLADEQGWPLDHWAYSQLETIHENEEEHLYSGKLALSDTAEEEIFSLQASEAAFQPAREEQLACDLEWVQLALEAAEGAIEERELAHSVAVQHGTAMEAMVYEWAEYSRSVEAECARQVKAAVAEKEEADLRLATVTAALQAACQLLEDERAVASRKAQVARERAARAQRKDEERMSALREQNREMQAELEALRTKNNALEEQLQIQDASQRMDATTPGWSALSVVALLKQDQQETADKVAAFGSTIEQLTTKMLGRGQKTVSHTGSRAPSRPGSSPTGFPPEPALACTEQIVTDATPALATNEAASESSDFETPRAAAVEAVASPQTPAAGAVASPTIRRRKPRRSAFDDAMCDGVWAEDACLDDVRSLDRAPAADTVLSATASAWSGLFGGVADKADRLPSGDDSVWGVSSLLAATLSSTLGSPRSPLVQRAPTKAAKPRAKTRHNECGVGCVRAEEMDAAIAMLGEV
eukprot:jgi/Ulvmu1/5955/UM026_0077.1